MENAKRILFIITQSEWGGAQSYVLHTALEAQRRGFEILVAAGGASELKLRCIQQNINYRELTCMQRSISPIKDMLAIRELIGLMREWMPSTVYLHSSKAGIIGSIAARLAKAPKTVYRIGGWSFLDPVSPIQRFMRRWSEQRTARFKDAIIVLHPGDEELAKRYDIRPKRGLVVIPNGLNVERFDIGLLPRDEARQRLMGETTGAPLILTVANFYATKNLVGYMDAVQAVHAQMPNAKFVIIGEGETRHEIEKTRNEYGLADAVSLPGALRDAAALLRGADLFVLPSSKEGMPWTLLEAMAARIPVVATDVGANAWMLGANGIVVPPGNPDRLAQAMLDTLEHPSPTAERVERARTDVETRFTEREMFEKTFQLLQ